MILKYSLYLLILFLLGSCANQESNKAENSPTDAKKSNSPINCYRYATADDTITLKLIHVGESITGTLVYKLKEKDKNMGTIQGAMRGDLLVADYTFSSEGVTSVRQIAFKKKENFLVEGWGDIITNNDKTSFKDLNSLQFNDSEKLIEIDCQK